MNLSKLVNFKDFVLVPLVVFFLSLIFPDLDFSTLPKSKLFGYN